MNNAYRAACKIHTVIHLIYQQYICIVSMCWWYLRFNSMGKVICNLHNFKHQQQLTIYDDNGFPIAYDFILFLAYSRNIPNTLRMVRIKTHKTVISFDKDGDSDRWILCAVIKFYFVLFFTIQFTWIYIIIQINRIFGSM